MVSHNGPVDLNIFFLCRSIRRASSTRGHF